MAYFLPMSMGNLNTVADTSDSFFSKLLFKSTSLKILTFNKLLVLNLNLTHFVVVHRWHIFADDDYIKIADYCRYRCRLLSIFVQMAYFSALPIIADVGAD